MSALRLHGAQLKKQLALGGHCLAVSLILALCMVSLPAHATATVTTTTALAASPNPAYVSQSVTLTATVTGTSPSGTVTFKDGTNSLGTGKIASGKATLTTSFTTSGSHSLTATYGGDTVNKTSTSSAVSESVKAKLSTTTALAASPNPAYVSQSVTLMATVTGTSPSGTVTFKDGTATLGTGVLASGKATLTTSFTTSGSHSLTAVYGGDTVNKTSTSSGVSESVKAKVSTSTALSSGTNPATVNQSITLTASVTGTSPTGNVTFKDGSATLGTGPISSGKATLITSFTTSGSHSLTAVYAGDTVNASSTSTTVSETVNQATTTTALSSSANPAYANQIVTLTATVTGISPTGSVTFKDGATTLGTSTLSNGQANLQSSFNSVGDHNLTASYGGDGGNTASTSSTVIVQVASTSATTSPGVMTWLYGYDALGNLTTATDPNGNQTTKAYDVLGRTNSIALPSTFPGTPQPQVTLQSDESDHLVQISDPRGLLTSYTIDGLGNRSAVSSPDTGVTNTVYDAAGNLISSTDARGKTTSYSYDDASRLIRVNYASGTATIFEYDGGSTPTPVANGHLTKVSDESGSTTYTYDAFGRILTKTQTVINNIGTSSLQVVYTWGSSGNAAGKLTSITYPSAMRVNYGYDSAGRISSVSVDGVNSSGVGTSSGATIAVLGGITYNGANAVLGWVWGNGSNYQRSYDSFGRLSSYELGNPAGTGSATGLIRTLTYDSAGRITGYSHSNNSGAQPQFDQSFDYDGLNQLRTMTLSTTSYSYTYDLNGNRTTHMVGNATYNDTVDPNSNRLTQVQVPSGSSAQTLTQTYDAVGHLTADGVATYTYSDRGRMSSATVTGGTVAYLYNALEQRVSKSGPSTLVNTGGAYYAYDENGHLVGEYDANLVPVYETVYIGSLPVAVVKQFRTGSGGSLNVQTSVSNVYADHLDTPRIITRNTDDAVLWRWDGAEAFGNTATNDNPTAQGVYVFNQRFPGQVYDQEVGSFYNINRNYSSLTGRYLQSDPIGLQGGLNTYAYVGGNPITRIDPTGLDWIYQQSTGILYHQPSIAAGGGPPQLVATGYAGHGGALNIPGLDIVQKFGPLPTGTYTIGQQQNNITGSGVSLPGSMRLTPDPSNWMFGRGGFLIHGDNSRGDQSASEGCIIMNKKARNTVGGSGDPVLRVVP